jgi:hypothetical protein
MISCVTCSSTFHLLCVHPPLSKEDFPNGPYFCENCRAIAITQEELINKDKQQTIILPFSFDPKKNLHFNGCHSTLGQIKLPTGITCLSKELSYIKYHDVSQMLADIDIVFVKFDN